MAVKRHLSMVFCANIFLVGALTQPLGKGVISGTTVDGESGEPIRKAVVTLTLEGTPHRWATARTDGSGRFQFEGLPAGKYDLRATKANEGTAIYGANSLREPGDSVTLGDSEIRGSLILRFLRSASISGHVYDSDGEPVAEANVNLLRQGRNLGAPILTSYRGTTTDDRGEYRIVGVDPGQYYLRTTSSMGRLGGVPGGHQTMLEDQYYGGARDSKDASPIHVSGGESLAGLDFRLISEQAVQVRGQVLGVPAEPELTRQQPARSGTLGIVSGVVSSGGGGMRDPGIQVTLSSSDLGQTWSTGTVAQGPEHRFQMVDLPAGRYRVEAVLHGESKTYAASQVFDLSATSGEIQLTLAPAADIQGTLRVEGDAARAGRPAGPRSSGNGFHVQLSRPGTRQIKVSAQVGADGRFSLEQVPPGDWQLAVTPVPPGFVKSARFGDKDVRFTTFEIGSSGEPLLNIVVSMNTATVEGEVDAGSSDSKRAGIVIAPVGLYHNLARFYYGAAADDKGKFKLTGIAPGKYKIFALEKMVAANFRTPEAADQLDELGEAIELAEGATLQTHPKLIPEERAAKAIQ